MIIQLAIALALTLAPPVEDVQLPTCPIGEEAQPFENGYGCGPADEALPEPAPSFVAEPAPVPPAPVLEAVPAPVVVPAPPVASVPIAEPSADEREGSTSLLAETGVVEERITALSVFAAIAIALGAGTVLTLMIRRRPSIDPAFDHLRDKNGHYTRLTSTDPGYPYGASLAEGEGS